MAASAASRVFLVWSQYVWSSSPVGWCGRCGGAQEETSSMGEWWRRERGRWMNTRSLCLSVLVQITEETPKGAHSWSKFWAWKRISSTFSFLSTILCFSRGKCSFQFTSIASALFTASSMSLLGNRSNPRREPIIRVRSIK